MYTLRFVDKKQLTDDTWSYSFLPETPVSYIAGQYAEFHHAAVDIGQLDRGQTRRVFTLTSIPSDRYITFASRLKTERSHFKQVLHALTPGDEVRMTEPIGDVILPIQKSTPLVFIAGGIGIASFVPIFRQIREENSFRDISLYYAMRSEADNPYADLLDRMIFSSRREFVPPDRISAQTVLDAAADSHALFYISGTEMFVEAFRHELESLGIGHGRIIFDYFTGYRSML